MKTKYWILAIAALALVCGVLSIFFLLPGQDAAAAEVWSEGELLCTLPLHIDQSVTVETAGGRNVVTVRDGRIAVTEADCPDHYCMDRGFCAGGAQIVCLPNRLVIKFVGGQTVDGVVG